MFFSSLFCAHSQKISKYERRWALAHPFAALKVKLISKKCGRIYQQESLRQELDYFVYGGKLDAFRHVFFMAACARRVKVHKLRKLGERHEKTNYRMFLRSKKEFGETADSLGSVMDLYNNEIGFKIGSENKKVSLDEIRAKCVEAVNNGEALIMKRKKNGVYLTCEDQILDLKRYAGQWSVPKCLVRSDFSYPD